jgi:hypothetical protein
MEVKSPFTFMGPASSRYLSEIFIDGVFYMKVSFFALTLFLSAVSIAHANVSEIQDPLRYAEDQSKLFSEGDTYDISGWEGCKYTDSSIRTPSFECTGTTTILIFGGEPASTPFTCSYEFEKKKSGRYEVKIEDCRYN